MIQKIIISFILTSLLFLFLGLLSISKMIHLADLAEQLYEHPLTVTNATKDIRIDLISMQQYMKEITLSENKLRLQASIDKINTNEQRIYNNYTIIFKQYLGEEADIRKSYDLFVSWKPIRDKVIALTAAGENEKADLMQKESLDHIRQLNDSVIKLIKFAQSKADEFREHAISTRNLSITVTAVVLIIILVLIFSLTLALVKNISSTTQKIEKQNEVIFLQSRMAQMGEMISMIAHQWRQPLSSISAIISHLKLSMQLDKFKFESAAEKQRFNDFYMEKLNQVEKNISTLSTVINDFRNFYKPDKASKTLLIEEPVRQALQIIEKSISADNIELTTEFKSQRTISIFDSEMMQVILNLLKNAQDNFKEKHIQAARIHIHTYDTPHSVILEVCDNGGGIPEEIIANVFDPYFSTKDEKNGTGLGLYMSKTIVEEHHKGTLSVVNREGGTCFNIELSSENSPALFIQSIADK